jgi:hypothetical protein
VVRGSAGDEALEVGIEHADTPADAHGRERPLIDPIPQGLLV